mgnify:CR=1 FL=1
MRPLGDVLDQTAAQDTPRRPPSLALDGLWALFEICLQNKKTSFSNPGHAHNLATKMNSLFKTDLFTVVKLTSGETVAE